MKKTVFRYLALCSFLLGAMPANAVITWIADSPMRNPEIADGKIWWETSARVPEWDVPRQLKRLDGNKNPADRNTNSGALIRYSQVGGKVLVEELDPNLLDSLAGMVRVMIFDAESRPWVVTKTSDLYRREGNMWKRLPTKLTDIAIGKNGAMWGLSDEAVREGGRTVLRYTGTSWEETGMSARLLAVDGSGEAWVTSQRNTKGNTFNVFRHTPGGWEEMPKINRPIYVASDDEGSIWMKDSDRKYKKFPSLYKWTGSDWEPGFHVEASDVPIFTPKGNPVFHKFYILEGLLPVIQGKGRLRTPNLGVSSYAISQDDSVWVIRKLPALFRAGYRPEILKWNGQRFEPGVDTKQHWKSDSQLLESDFPIAIAADGKGSPWILADMTGTSTLGTLYRHVDDAWVKADSRKMVSILSDVDGVIWALGGAVFRWDGGSLKQVGEALPAYVSQFVVDQDRAPWVVHKNMQPENRNQRFLVSRQVQGKWENVALPDDFTLLSPALGGGMDGSIWLGGRLKSKFALMKWTGSGWKRHSGSFLGEHISSDSKGRVWSISDGSFAIADPGLRALTPKQSAGTSPEKPSASKQREVSVPTPAPVPETRLAGSTSKAELVGCWKWFNGAYIIAEKNGVVRNGIISGSWTRVASSLGDYTIEWPSIFDMVKLSDDGQSFSGANIFGMPVSGTRISAVADGLSGEWRWFNGIKVSIGQDKTVEGGGFQGSWKKTGDGYAIEWPIIDTIEVSADGNQLKGANQFGPVTANLDKACAGP